jgi:tRNA-splicing ligase RtcB
MEYEIFSEKTKVPIFSWCSDIGNTALEQAENVSNLFFAFHHIALMPDCHPGFGMPIGCVAGFKDFIVPNAVGVDIGCGMGAVRTDISADSLNQENIKLLFSQIEKKVPTGFDTQGSKQKWDGFDNFFNNFKSGKPGWLSKKIMDRAEKSLGTLGGGNHFIELQKDEKDFVWLMLHSGSRNLGKTIADHYHRKALDYCKKNGIELSSEELAGLPSDSKPGKAYIRDMNFALNFAAENRKRMMKVFKDCVASLFNSNFTMEINIHHNYASYERHFNTDLYVHRKGATSAKQNEKGIIPGSMGTPSYIVEGLGEKNSFMSCSHGAGRKMGRNQACRNLDISKCENDMKGIFHKKFPEIKKGKLKGKFDVSEAPGAYKNIDEVINSQKDLVKILFKLFPLGSLKG